MGTTKRYPAEVRERAVRLVLEHRREYPTEWAAITSIAEKFGMGSETLRKWVRRAEVDDGMRPGVTSAEAQRIKELERENRELRRANEILKADSVPVKISAIARKLGVGLFVRPFPDALSAFLLRGEGRSVIGVNSNQPLVRQCFSAAHECGHFVLLHADESVFDYAVPATSDGEPPGYDWQNERAANTFAAELLMPEDRLRQEAPETSLPRLATRYKVSKEAMSFRLLNLGLRAS